MPFFSIICVSYNEEKNIVPTINSVLGQTFDDYEIIVKDACSKDNTVKNIPDDERIKIYVTEDKGIYYGMNEAIGYASGKYLLFLNCGDCFADENVLANIYCVAKNLNFAKSIIYGNYIRKNIHKKQPSKITDFYLYRTPMCHQTMFFSKNIFIDFLYDTEYIVLADYDLTIKCLKNGVRFIYVDNDVSNYLGDGFSESEKTKKIIEDEYRKITSKYYSKTKRTRYKTKIFFTFKGLRKKIASDKSPFIIRKIYRKLVNFVNQ